MKAIFDSTGINITQYPFPPASIYPHGRIECSDIRDVDPDAGPLEIRTRRGETLFVSAEQSDAFHDWITKSHFPIVRRVDAWHLILEPFLDTEFTSEQQKQTLVALRDIGIPRTDVMRIRGSVESAMLAYNVLLWDWVHLGLFDVLTATRQGLSWISISHRLFRNRYSAFYWSAMELADRGRNVIAEMATEQCGQPGTRSIRQPAVGQASPDCLLEGEKTARID
jgi:hypothetical protein